MSSKSELTALIKLQGKVDPSLLAAMSKTSGETKKLSDNIKESSKHMSSFGKMIGASFIGNLASNAVSFLSSKVVQLGRDGLKLASDLSEVQNVVDTTFKDSSGEINQWSKTALKAYGLTELQAKQYSGTMGAMLKSSGINQKDMVLMSENLTGLSGDFASFYNLDHEAAWEKIRSGMSGQTEGLQQLGINMSVANLQNYALSKGIKVPYADMDQASQTLLRYNYLMDVSKDAQGDFAKTQDSFANQQKLFKANFQELATTIQTQALPYLTEFLKKGNEFITNFDIAGAADKAKSAFKFLGDSIKFVMDNSDWLIPVLAGVAASLKAFSIIMPIVKAYREWTLITEGATAAQWLFNLATAAFPGILIAAAIGAVVAAAIVLYKNWDKVSQFLIKSVDWVKEAFATGINSIIGMINWLIEKLNKLPGVNIPLIAEVGYRTSADNAKYSLSAAKSMNAMDGYADGGFASKASIFGESGLEAAIPIKRNSPRSLSLLNQTAQMLGVKGEGKNVYININVTANGDGAQGIASTVKEVVTEVLEEIFHDKERVSFG